MMKNKSLNRGLVFVFVALLLWITGCGPTFMDVGKQYMARNNPGVAAEYFMAGHREKTGDKALWNDYVMASLLNESRLRHAFQDLEAGGQHYMALKKLYLLYDSLARARAMHRGDARPGVLGRDIETVRPRAALELVNTVDRDMQVRAAKGDLAVLRRAMALNPGDRLLRQRYQALLDRFKFYTRVRFARDSALKPRDVQGMVARRLAIAHKELLQPVGAGSSKYNADLVLDLVQPEFFDTGWVMVRRRAFHKWVPKRDRKGRLVYERVRVCKRVLTSNGNKVVKCHNETRLVYVLVYGELRFFRRHQEVDIPWNAALKHLGTHNLTLAVTGVATAGADSRYFVYRGHPWAREAPAGWPEGERHAKRLPGRGYLVRQALYKLGQDAASGLLSDIEQGDP